MRPEVHFPIPLCWRSRSTGSRDRFSPRARNVRGLPARRDARAGENSAGSPSVSKALARAGVCADHGSGAVGRGDLGSKSRTVSRCAGWCGRSRARAPALWSIVSSIARSSARPGRRRDRRSLVPSKRENGCCSATAGRRNRATRSNDLWREAEIIVLRPSAQPDRPNSLRLIGFLLRLIAMPVCCWHPSDAQD